MFRSLDIPFHPVFRAGHVGSEGIGHGVDNQKSKEAAQDLSMGRGLDR
jgi:hypothetical protein